LSSINAKRSLSIWLISFGAVAGVVRAGCVGFFHFVLVPSKSAVSTSFCFDRAASKDLGAGLHSGQPVQASTF
jgi:hypothetical protein